MKKLFYLGLTALMMLFAMPSVVRAQDGEGGSESGSTENQIGLYFMDLMMTPVQTNATIGRYYTPIAITLGSEMSYGEEVMVAPAETPFTLYYTTDGTTTPSREAYEQQEDKTNGAIKKAEYDGSEDMDPMFAITTVTEADNFVLKVIAYVANEVATESDDESGANEPTYTTYTKEGTFTFVDVATPAFDVTGEVVSGTKVYINNAPNQAQVFYTTKDKLPLHRMLWDEDEEDIEIYDGEEGIEITGEVGAQVTVKAISYIMPDASNSMNYAGSKLASVTYTIKTAEVTPDPVQKPTAPAIDKADGAYAANTEITISKGEADSIFVATGKTVAEATVFVKALADVTVTLTADTVIRAYAMKDDSKSDTVVRTYTVTAGETPEPVKPAAPTFDPEAGEVPFGTEVTLECETAGADIYFTTDGTTPTTESEEYTWRSEIIVTKAMTVKAIAVLDGVSSDVAEAAYTAAAPKAEVVLSSVKDNMVGKNVSTGITIRDPENEASAGWMQQYPATVYYTLDGQTVPSKEAYEAQTDKENGAIKMIAVKWEEQDGWYGPVQDVLGNLMSITFTTATQFKAIGYMTISEDMTLVTPVFDQELGVQSEENPAFSIASYSKVASGDTLVIANPNPYPARPEDPEDWDDEEAVEAYFTAVTAWQEATADIPATILYFSFDGTKPTPEAYASQDADWDLENPYSTYSVFKTERAGLNLEITFGENEEGYYAYVPAIKELLYMPGTDTIRLKEDGMLSVQVLAVTTETEGGDGPSPLSAKAVGGAASFMYGSDFVTAHYSMNADFPAVELTFNPASGSEVDENTTVTITANREGEIFYMMFESEEAAKAAEWNQEEAESYSTELKPVLSMEKNTIKAAYAAVGAEAVEATFFYATYKVKELPAITLTFDPASGSKVKDSTRVTVTASRETEIFYVLYADKVDADSSVTTFIVNAKEVKEDGMPVITKESTFLRCGVYDKGSMQYFDATYTIDATANEGRELAGVSLYPNPTEGEFNVVAPAAAQVEIFNAAGMLVKRVNVNAGVNALRLENSGIYFVRVSANGQVAVKKVVVR